MNTKNEEIAEEMPVKGFKRFVKKPGKKLFWTWIAYQAVKGTLTTSLIWVPIIYFWWTH